MSQNENTSSTQPWTSVQAYTLAVLCLLLGIAGGWLIRGSQARGPESGVSNTAAAVPGGGSSGAEAQPTADQMKKMADTQAAPLLAKLPADPNNPELLANIANIYYDTQQYPTAIDFYQRSLKVQPSNVGVRTDMATAYWYSGNADGAIAEFNQVLSTQPSSANALFNLGIVKWQGKMDVEGAVAVWQKLLDTNPTYEGKEKVQQLIAQVRKHKDLKPGTPAKPLAE
ncbi:MAG: tetratricopeptide repeat protein [Acidobacteriia bacterium]|nr:tetratricopeptide repeat protein [Terriglobia bacterium]